MRAAVGDARSVGPGSVCKVGVHLYKCLRKPQKSRENITCELAPLATGLGRSFISTSMLCIVLCVTFFLCPLVWTDFTILRPTSTTPRNSSDDWEDCRLNSATSVGSRLQMCLSTYCNATVSCFS